MFKIVLSSLLLHTVLSAGTFNVSDYSGYLYLSALFIFIVLCTLYINLRKKYQSIHTTLEEKEEKITWLRQIQAKNETRDKRAMEALEKKSIEQRHSIEKLEQKLREGTKNQVIAKLEALERKRQETTAQLHAED
jgi:uncharacterized membrane protein YgaE (UPF0421/DUF939 family)